MARDFKLQSRHISSGKPDRSIEKNLITPTLVMDTFPDFNTPGFDMDRYNQRFYNSNVVIRASARAIEYPTHWGPLSIKCVLNGEETYETGNCRYVVDADNFLLFNNGKMYSSRIDSPVVVNSFTLNIAPAFEKLAIQSIRGCEDYRFVERLYRHDHSITKIIQQINRASDNHEELDQCFYDLMQNLLYLDEKTHEAIEKVDKVNASTKKEIFQRLVRARDFIYSCYKETLTIDVIANIACMNPFSFLRQFKTLFGISPHQFLIKRRMEIAMQLMKTTDKQISDICIDVGFSDPSSFTKLFRKHYGFAPSALRM